MHSEGHTKGRTEPVPWRDQHDQSESVATSVVDSTLWVRLNRPEALNSISFEVITKLHDALDRAEADTNVRTLVLTGTGRAFCAGADLKYVNSSDDGSNGFRRLLGELLNRIETFPKPVIAAVNGLALGGGLELILCCDLVVAADTARVGDGHANYGLLPGGGASVRLPRAVGRVRALEMFYTGDLFSAADLAAWGLFNRVVAEPLLEVEAGRVAKQIADKSPLGIARMKQLVNQAAEQTSATGLSLELVVSALHEKSHDMAEGVAAFVEKRRPAFDGS